VAPFFRRDDNVIPVAELLSELHLFPVSDLTLSDNQPTIRDRRLQEMDSKMGSELYSSELCRRPSLELDVMSLRPPTTRCGR